LNILVAYLNNSHTFSGHMLYRNYAYNMHNIFIRYSYAISTEIKWSHFVKVCINSLLWTGILFLGREKVERLWQL